MKKARPCLLQQHYVYCTTGIPDLSRTALSDMSIYLHVATMKGQGLSTLALHSERYWLLENVPKYEVFHACKKDIFYRPSSHPMFSRGCCYSVNGCCDAVIAQVSLQLPVKQTFIIIAEKKRSSICYLFIYSIQYHSS